MFALITLIQHSSGSSSQCIKAWKGNKGNKLHFYILSMKWNKKYKAIYSCSKQTSKNKFLDVNSLVQCVSWKLQNVVNQYNW